VTVAAILAVGTFGAFIGSFLNVVVYRVPLGRSVVSPGSACGACGHAIRWYDNIPLVSWLLLRGKCRDCGSGISARYPLVELGTAAFLALAAWRFVPEVAAGLEGASANATIAAGLQTVAFLYLAAISLALAIIDVETHRLPNALVLPAFPVGVALLGISAALSGAWLSLLTGLAVAVAFAVIYAVPAFARPGSMGMGDVKLAGVLGLYLGWLGLAPAGVGLLAGFILGGGAGLALLLSGRGRTAKIAFGPWLLAGAWVGILFGEPLAEAYLSLYGLG
jgi:leader peptidase (prepilin peptidase)/N-methyltransferase